MPKLWDRLHGMMFRCRMKRCPSGLARVQRAPERGSVSGLESDVSIEPGHLYVVATPIGNLGDMTPRAVDVLRGVDRIAAEDTRHSRPLLEHFGITTPAVAYHEHNERQQAEKLVAALQRGESVALISDAGTPLLSDPGYRLVRAARDAGLVVLPIPGPSALIAALSVAGLPTDRFVFEGFLPAKAAARRTRLQQLAREPRTLVFYEAGRRIEESLADMEDSFGGERQAVIARELTKAFETVHGDGLARLRAWLSEDPDRRRGEFVVLVHGAPEADQDEAEADRVLGILVAEVGVRQAAALAAQITGLSRNRLYRRALELSGES